MKLFYLIKFAVLFSIQFLNANLNVAYVALFVKRSRLRPQLVDYDVQDLTYSEMLMMAQLITLTPGTIVTNIDDKRKLLTVHILNTEDPQAVLQGINQKIKRILLEVTR